MTRQCPECGKFTSYEKDPNLPETHRNVMCGNMDCHVEKLGEVEV